MPRNWSNQETHQQDAPVIVSITSYAPRFPWLSLTLRCLLTQSVKPDAVILWIAHDDFPDLPDEVLALQAHGLTIEQVPDLKSYKKLIPALQKFGYDINHVIADDDIYYPSNWLESLFQHGDGKTVVCHLGREWLNHQEQIFTYQEWPAIKPGACSMHGLIIGNGGVWFPPGSLGPEANDYELALELCPLQDDVWFSWQVLMRGFLIKRSAISMTRFNWPGSDIVALSYQNDCINGGNDVAIQKIINHYGMPFPCKKSQKIPLRRMTK